MSLNETISNLGDSIVNLVDRKVTKVEESTKEYANAAEESATRATNAANTASSAATTATNAANTAAVQANIATTKASDAAESATDAAGQANLLSQVYQEVIQQGQITVPAVDANLAVSGAAADAKATGDLTKHIKYSQFDKSALGNLFCYEGPVNYGSRLYISHKKFTETVTSYEISFKIHIDYFEGTWHPNADLWIGEINAFNPATGNYWAHIWLDTATCHVKDCLDGYKQVTITGTSSNSSFKNVNAFAVHWNTNQSDKNCKYYIEDLKIKLNDTVITEFSYDCTYDGACGSDLSESPSYLATKNYVDSKDELIEDHIGTAFTTAEAYTDTALATAKAYTDTETHNLLLSNLDKNIIGNLFSYEGIIRYFEKLKISHTILSEVVTSYDISFKIYVEYYNGTYHPNAELMVYSMREFNATTGDYYSRIRLVKSVTVKQCTDGFKEVHISNDSVSDSGFKNINALGFGWNTDQENTNCKYYIKDLRIIYNGKEMKNIQYLSTYKGHGGSDLSEPLSVLSTKKYVNDSLIPYVNKDYVAEQFQLYEAKTKSSLKRIACYGDSITAGGSPGAAWATVLQGLVGENVTIINCGVSGQCSGAIAFRQGGVKIIVHEDFTIPATTEAATFTATSTSKMQNLIANSASFTVKINGIEGQLTYVSRDDQLATFNFTRSTAGEAVSVLANTEVISVQAIHEDETVILWTGRNDMAFSYPYQVTGPIDNYALMIKHLSPDIKRFLIISTTTTTGETSETDGYTKIASINSQLAELYPYNFVDIRRYLIDQCIYDAGITPTAEDLEKIAGDTIPPSLMYDSVHPNAIAKQYIAQYLYKELEKRGWA